MSLRDLLIDIEPLRASRDFRAVFIARTVSLFGLGVATVALASQVYDLSGSTLTVAAVGMVMSVSVLIGSLVGGVLADRHDRRMLIVSARAAATLAFAGLAVNAYQDSPKLWAVFPWVAWDGLASGVSITALMAVAPTLVRRDQLPAAGALLALTTEIGSVVAPFLGGMLLAAAGPGTAFAVTAATTAVTTLLVTRLRPLPPVFEEPEEDEPAEARDDRGAGAGGGAEGPRSGADNSLLGAVRYALRHRVVGGLLLLGGATSLFGVPVVLLPELVDVRYGGGTVMLGLLYSAPAVGAVLTSATSGWIGRSRRPGAVLIGAVLVSGLAIVGFGLSPSVVPAFLALAVAGAAGTVAAILDYALLQHHTPDRLRGRMSGFVTAQGTTGEIGGEAEVALLARWFSPGGAAVINGVICALAAVAVALTVPGLRNATLPDEDEGEEAADDSEADPKADPEADLKTDPGADPETDKDSAATAPPTTAPSAAAAPATS
ncbi:MFS transporter, ENTS family, enterobactin (siderophore) exporter [Streptomyces sp. TLI_053]|uniref:MFS transporter n=1 Tax=Streptomyces sp. TLI_053 TaxID=1855352 RepID=UPI000879B0C4|nr:MFS transporter [Streptomyces sp. TLI_053]SDS75717.1 MFS transporter, ENTS family, enterobactin (siderophore) exporter [Streptomyces sp. TLI_053]